MFDFRNIIRAIGSFIHYIWMTTLALIRGVGKDTGVPQDRKWWQRPGLGIMYQIETRPGWRWDRDYTEFNKSMAGEDGGINFNGPFCKTGEWVRLSEETGADYHIFEVKWHDGICYFNTGTTEWKTEEDYAKEFADLSREAGIPFMFYYSSVFDHNPDFDDIQPKPHQTPSLIGNRPEYLEYLKKHYDELMDQYKPDGLWLDWYWADRSTSESIDYLREKYPGLVIAFNLSNLFPSSFRKIDITSGETHSYDGPMVKMRKEDRVKVPVLTAARTWCNLFRMVFSHQWEVISPAGRWWQDQSLRDDPLELIKIMAMALACGGKFTIGATARMDGRIFPDQVKQLKMLGEWYKPRRELFTEAAPMRYRWLFDEFPVMCVRLPAKGYDSVVSRYRDGVLLHVINRGGDDTGIPILLYGSFWRKFKYSYLLPRRLQLHFRREGRFVQRFDLMPGYIDPVDNIIFFTNELLPWLGAGLSLEDYPDQLKHPLPLSEPPTTPSPPEGDTKDPSPAGEPQ